MQHQMKKLVYLFSIAALTLMACTKEMAPVVDDNVVEDAVLTFSSERPQLDPATRTEWNGNTVIWSTNDKIRVGYTLDGAWMGQSEAATSDNPAKLYASNNVTIDPTSPNVGTFNVPVGNSFFTDHGRSGNYTFYTVYPHTSTDATAASAPLVTISVPTAQTPGADTFDSSADIMVGKTATLSLNGFPSTPMGIKWTRIVAHGFLTFKDLQDVASGETVTKIVLTAQSTANIVGSQQVSLEDKSYSAFEGESNVTNTLTIQGTNLSFVTEMVNEEDMTNLKAWICILPETITSLDVDIETNRAHYTRTITGISKQFLANRKNNLTINMAEATRTPKGDQLIEDGYYVISYGQYMMTVGNTSESFRGYTNLNTTDPADDAIWYIEYVPASDAYTIRSLSESLYLCGSTTDGDTYLNLANAPSNITTNFFSIEKSSETATTYKISSVGGVRSIGFNNNSNQHRFAMYKGNTDQLITLNITPIGVVEDPLITIDEEERTKTVTATDPVATFIYVANHFATEAPSVTVTSDTDGIINGTPVAINGVITVQLNENTTQNERSATLSVTGTGISSPITLTIHQLGAPAPATVGTILWSENWTGATTASAASASATPSANYGFGTTVWNNGTVIYSQSDNSVYVRNENTGGGSAPELLLSKNQTWTVSSIPTGGATKLSLTWSSNNTSTTISVTPSTATVSGSSKSYIIEPNGASTISIVFSASSNSRLDNLVLTVTEVEQGGPGNTVSTPTFSVAGGTYSTAQTVEIQCETSGATIYYTLDGTTPDNTKNQYSTPLTISSTTTVKAIAIKDNVSSEIATATYTISTGLMTIAEVIAASANTSVYTQGVVAQVNQKGFIITDGSNNISVYQNATPSVVVGQSVSVRGIRGSYNNVSQIDGGDDLVITSGDTGQEVIRTSLTTITSSNATEHTTNDYISLSGKLTTSNNYYNVSISGSSTKGSLYQIDPNSSFTGGTLTSLINKNVIVTGYITGSTSSYLYIAVVDIQEDESSGGEEKWNLVSSLSDITAGTYAIAALNSSKYYTVPNTTISGQTFTCIEATYDATDGLTLPSGAGVFTFTAVSGKENAFYIYNTDLGKYLVATGSKKFGYVDSNSSNYGYWTFSNVSSGGFSGVFSVKHSNTSHYMRAYNNTVRCYDGQSNSGVYLFIYN